MTNIFTSLDYDVQTGKTLSSVEHEGFTITAKVVDDDDADLSFYGEFSNTPKEGAIEHELGTHHTFNYFNPADKEYAQEAYKRMCSYGESWTMYGAKVIVSKKGVKLAEASLRGIESDSDDAYFLEVFNDLASEALTEAKSKLNELCAA